MIAVTVTVGDIDVCCRDASMMAAAETKIIYFPSPPSASYPPEILAFGTVLFPSCIQTLI